MRTQGHLAPEGDLKGTADLEASRELCAGALLIRRQKKPAGLLGRVALSGVSQARRDATSPPEAPADFLRRLPSLEMAQSAAAPHARWLGGKSNKRKRRGSPNPSEWRKPGTASKIAAQLGKCSKRSEAREQKVHFRHLW